MFAARADQENAVHAQQTAAAAKPLNQGLKGLTAKTPGNRAPKTPFKIPLNDENAAQAGKSGLKTNGKGAGERGFGTVKKGGALGDRNAFVTPAGPRSRAPLGAKTTNAKALQTPAPLNAEPSADKTNLKTVSPRLRRAKVKIHQAEAIGAGPAEEPEIEYMPPRAKPLPDYPSDDEFGPAKTFPQFSPQNFSHGWPSVYSVDDDGVSLFDKRDAEHKAMTDAYTDELLKKSMEDSLEVLERNILEDLEMLHSPTKSTVETDSPPKKSQPAARKPVIQLFQPPTLAAKSAASALARPASTLPSYAAPTGATKGKVSTVSLLASKTRPAAPLAPSASRHATAAAASHSTLGYAKGRAASQGLRKPLSNIFMDDTSVSNVPAAAAASKKDAVKELEEIVRARDEARATEEDEDENDLFGGGGVSLTLGEEDEEEEFQLSIPPLV